MGRASSSRRREEIRKNRPDIEETLLGRLLRPHHHVALAVAIGFAVCITAILMLRPQVVGWRVGQFTPHDIVARVDFEYHDSEKLNSARTAARLTEPRVYRMARINPFDSLKAELLALPETVKGQRVEQLSDPLKSSLDAVTLEKLQEYSDPIRQAAWQDSVDVYIRRLHELDLRILPDIQKKTDAGRNIRLPGIGPVRADDEKTLSPAMKDELVAKFSTPAQANFSSLLAPRVAALTAAKITPNFELDEIATTQAQNQAADTIDDTLGDVAVMKNMIFVERGEIGPSEYIQLKAEHDAFLKSLGNAVWWQRLGLMATVIALTVVGSMYVATYQPRIVKNHARALGLASLMISMLLLAQLTGLGSTRSYIFGLAPTIMVATILAIAYDQRFAMGLAGIHALMATLALGEGLDFLIVLMTGVMTCCFLLDDVRTRSKLIELGGACALAMMGATFAAGWLNMDPMAYIVKNAIYSGAAGLAVGFLALGILPFIEKTFRITTSMTLLELADASHPLLRRLSMEAPGTYNHSLQVATLSEEAAESIGANSLLCRVAAYYHDVGKINKPEYFVENQGQAGNRHVHLSPSVSLLIIIGHVKDGVELAKEYALPSNVMPFIQQHHGTTLVEFFYHRACKEAEKMGPMEQEVQQHQYRYPGPKPRTRETAICMLADCCESACRAMQEPNPARIEQLVHDLAMKRLLDGQFDESELTMRELELIERSLVKSLLGLYHGRIAYPTDKPSAQPSLTQPNMPTSVSNNPPEAKTA
ncbi:MAG: receptor with intracellular hydrolase [Phycisphaerales bacterium]|nr:receptor with intracellular hydrolase [Phycisphaerales bacterium]